MINLTDLFIEYDIPNWEFRKPGILRTIENNTGMMVYDKSNGSKISDTNYFYHSQFPYDESMESVIVDFLNHWKDKGYIPQWHGQCWHQIYERGDFHGWHTHSGLNMSAVINIQCEEGQGTVFRIGEKEYQYPSREGTVVAFPGAFLHQTLPHESDEPRIIASFNWDFLGVGNHEREV